MINVLALHEILHETRRRGEVGVVVKLDFEKAFDMVNWPFLLRCLQVRGFSRTWCEWISKVLKDGTVAVRLNNKLGPYFQSCKGGRQGDLLSPILFNFAVDCLTGMVIRAQQNLLIIGLVSHLIPRGVAILQYTDDTIVCLEHSLEGARNMKLLSYLFEQMVGLKINFDKSEVLMISGDRELVVAYEEIFNCNTNEFPLKYLRVPISAGRIHVSDWLKLEEKSAKKLGTWQGGDMSYGGRTILINASLTNSSIYQCQCFFCPRLLSRI
jgi:hypothetical protein